MRQKHDREHLSTVLLRMEGNKVTKLKEVEVGGLPEPVAFKPDGKYIYVGNFFGKNFSILRVDGNDLVDTGKKLMLNGDADVPRYPVCDKMLLGCSPETTATANGSHLISGSAEASPDPRRKMGEVAQRCAKRRSSIKPHVPVPGPRVFNRLSAVALDQRQSVSLI